MPLGGENIGGLGQEGDATDYYCTTTDVSNRIGAKQLGQLTNDNAGDSIDTTVMDALRLKAYNFINSKLNGNYTIPFSAGSSTPGIINQIAIDLVCYYAMLRRFVSMEVPKTWQDTYDVALETLEQINAGTLTIVGVDPTGGGDIVNVTTNPIANFWNRGNDSQVSEY